VWKLWKLTVTKATLISDQITVKTHKRLNVSLWSFHLYSIIPQLFIKCWGYVVPNI